LREVVKLEKITQMEFKHPNRSFVAFVFIFLLVIVIGLLTINRPDLQYKISTEETIEQIITKEYEFYPEDLAGIVEFEDSSYTIVDLRNPYEFIKGHIKGALNIPSNSLLDKENIKLFDQFVKDSLIVVLYGQNQLEANGPWMILQQMGYENIKVLLGGYDYFTTGPLDMYDMPEIPDYLVEEPAYDYYGIMEALGSRAPDEASSDQPEVVIPTRKKKETVVEGGC
jgi:rhodanese-related sulfurtransferase